MAGYDTSLEATIQRIGRHLAERSAKLSPTVFDRRWWTGSLLQWCMKDEAFKVQLFRFIDVLPSLSTHAQISQLLDEYFGSHTSVSKPIQWGLRAMAGSRVGSHVGSALLYRQFLQMARTFVTGATIKEALPVLSKAWNQGIGTSISLLGEATVSEVEADAYQERCLEALRLLSQASHEWSTNPILERDHLGAIPRVQLSIKISALYSQLDPLDPDGSYEGVAARLRPILHLAASIPAAITFDMEHVELKELTFAVFMNILMEESFRSYPYAGIALQAYLKDSPDDLERLLQWVRDRGTPIGIRLIKGAYWDAETILHEQRRWPIPVFQNKAETDANYETLSKALLAQTDLVRPAFGTHNLRSLAHAAAFAQAKGVPPGTCEYQMLFGMGETLQEALAQDGYRMRIYAPVGPLIPGMAYLVRRLLENTSNESCLRRHDMEGASLDDLLAAPELDAARPQADPPDDHAHQTPSPDDAFRNEPHTDFSKTAGRTEMRDVIERVRRQLGRRISYVLSSHIKPSGPELVSRNPSDPENVVARLQGFAPDDVDAVIAAACRKLEEWRSTPPGKRADLLCRTAKLMRRRRLELAAWEIFETGKSWRDADADVTEAIDFLEYYARDMRKLGSPQRLGREPGELNDLEYRPRGLAVILPPWNFPLAIPTGMVSAALVTGNVVLFKPSERAPVMGSLLADLFSQAGLPNGILHFVPGGPEIGRALVSHPEVRLIAFTGSKDVGLGLMSQAAELTREQGVMKHVVAEMGGKNAIIVDESADLDEAVTGVVTSLTAFQGQKCSACSRVIVLDAVYDTFVDRLTEAAKSIHIGPPDNPIYRMGPMIDERARRKVQEYIEIGKKEGRLILERTVDGPGYFIGPALFADINPSHRLAQEEIFGPVLAVMRAGTIEEAIQIANTSSYALTGGIYSRSPVNIEKARARFEAGNFYINRPIIGSMVGRQPFGGYGLSGIGAKAGGENYLRQFMVERVVTENTMRRGFAPSE